MAGSKIVIDGQEYPLPDLGEIDMEQAMVIERYTGLSLEELGQADTTRASLVAAYCHLAILESDPRRTFAQIEATVKKVKLAHLEFAADEEVADNPPASTQNETGSELKRSGEISGGPSVETPEPTLSRIGTPV